MLQIPEFQKQSLLRNQTNKKSIIRIHAKEKTLPLRQINSFIWNEYNIIKNI